MTKDIGYIIRRSMLYVDEFYFVDLMKQTRNSVSMQSVVNRSKCIYYFAGTVDSWLLWNLIGGVHVTDVSNASRTMLMDIETLEWDPFLLNFFKIPKNILPKILSSSEVCSMIEYSLVIFF